MIYEKAVTIPKNTPEGSPVLEYLDVHPGNLRHVSITFPSGCVGLAHLRILYFEHQVFPSNVDSSFSGDGLQIAFAEDMDLKEPPYSFKLVGWNEDDTYPHTVTVRMQIVPVNKSILSILSSFFVGPSGPVSSSGG